MNTIEIEKIAIKVGLLVSTEFSIYFLNSRGFCNDRNYFDCTSSEKFLKLSIP
jgi:hypothetical protein